MADISRKFGKAKHWANELISAKKERDEGTAGRTLSSRMLLKTKKLGRRTKKIVRKVRK
jgi:hypothetical protein